MKKTTLRKYARLIAQVGANVRKGQPVIVYANVEQYEFAGMVVEECYRCGARSVRVEWKYQQLSKLAYRFQSIKTLSTVERWEEEKMKLMAEELPCRILLIGEDPDGLRGINLEKMQKAHMATYKVMKPYRDAIESKHQWTIAAVPSEEWAKKVFPGLKKNQAVERLWRAILDAVSVTDDPANDPIAEWERHNAEFSKRCKWLNDQKFDYLTYKSSNGTDFRADLIPEGHWCGGGEVTKQGIFFNPNLPTEEIFTSPMKGRAEGRLVSTKPLSYNGQLIRNFWIRFKDGRAVEWDAESGREVLDKMITMDDGAAMLGELALIPCNSPINNSGILFYETLFDENASCHVALGRGFNDCIDGYLDKTNEECQALGINDSIIHVDFMVGAPDMCITGYKNGRAVPIFVNGEWAE